MWQPEGVNGIWAWLTGDVSLLGGVQSPLLSWLGGAGIVVLCLWHAVMLVRGILRLRAAVGRIESHLQHLNRARQQTSSEWIVIPSLAKKAANGSGTSGARRDLDDLEALDRVMRGEPAYAHDWLSFRKSLAVEQSSWFMEPTVSASQSASGFFSFETACANELNVRFYQQLPSLLTGLGLLCTFLAILVGLSKLHANGAHIEGLQGLINGLAGKFVTSIVGLACANAFLLLEKSLWHGLGVRHRRMVALLDEIFPQKVRDHGLPHSASAAERVFALEGGAGDQSAHRLAQAVQQRLDAAVEALNGISRTLAARGYADMVEQRDTLAADIGDEVRKALAPVCDPLRAVMDDLTRTLHALRPSPSLSVDDIDRLVKQLGDRLKGDRALAAVGDSSRAGWRFPRFRPRAAGEKERA
jgi:hypothetical protein